MKRIYIKWKIQKYYKKAVSEDSNKTDTCTVKGVYLNGNNNGQNSENGGNNGSQGGKDDTTAKGKLPQTGINMAVTFGTIPQHL